MGELFARETNHKGITAVELESGRYYAIVAPTIGNNVLRLRDNEKNMEVLRYKDEADISEIVKSPYLWGLQPLYPQNRFEDGIIKTSDAVYKFPLNEANNNNHIHGFIHNRVFTVKDMGASDGVAFVDTEYTYDENDYFYNCMPVKFRLEIKTSLSENGLTYTMTFFNLSDKVLPISAAAHTAINAPFVDGARQEDMLIELPVSERVVADEKRWLPTGEFAPLNDYDLLYKNGKMRPVLRDINNNHYRAAETTLDGKPFRGSVFTDTASGKRVGYEIDENFKFWILWNQGGFNGFFCPEPLSAIINAPNIPLPREQTGYHEVLPGESHSLTQRIFTC
ncbi:MAG: aldose 1-epimerase [Oscillospiraceae bacterium]|nr:aldose 1-epimerase [Oscillospiraceae bacterium]